MPIPASATPESSAHRSASTSVARNSAIYFLSLGVPAIAALFLVPVTVHVLGPSRFGLLALAWAVAEGSGMFDLGLGRATVRFVADAKARDDEKLHEIILAALYSQTAMGAIAGALLFIFAPVLLSHVFSVAPESVPEATAMFRVLAFHLPILLAIASLRAALEGAQRFELSAALRIPGALASIAIPAAGAVAGYSLSGILWLLLAVRIVLLLAGAFALGRVLLRGRWTVPMRFALLRGMLSYSGWVAVSTLLGPALASFDRFVVGSVVGVAGLGFYTGAAEAATRFLLIPVTAFSALFPALSGSSETNPRERLLSVTRAARRQLAAVMLPLCLGLAFFAPFILHVWLGAAFGDHAGQALRILAVGVFLTGLAHLPMALLYGSGRPDLVAKINLIQVALHIPLTIFLVRTWGITGAAVAWTVRCASDLVLYEWVSRRAIGTHTPDQPERERTKRLWIAGFLLSIVLTFTSSLNRSSHTGAAVMVGVALILYVTSAWLQIFTEGERHAWTAILLPAAKKSTF